MRRERAPNDINMLGNISRNRVKIQQDGGKKGQERCKYEESNNHSIITNTVVDSRQLKEESRDLENKENNSARDVNDRCIRPLQTRGAVRVRDQREPAQ